VKELPVVLLLLKVPQLYLVVKINNLKKVC